MKCIYIKENGSNCNAYCMRGSEYCFLHNPAISKETKKESQSKGGKQSPNMDLGEPLDPIELKGLQDVSILLVDTVHRVRSKEMDIKTANCIGFLCNHLMKVYELTQLERKLDVIKNTLHK